MKAWDYLASIKDYRERITATARVREKMRRKMAGQPEAEIKAAWNYILARTRKTVEDNSKMLQAGAKEDSDIKTIRRNKIAVKVIVIITAVMIIVLLGAFTAELSFSF